MVKHNSMYKKICNWCKVLFKKYPLLSWLTFGITITLFWKFIGKYLYTKLKVWNEKRKRNSSTATSNTDKGGSTGGSGQKIYLTQNAQGIYDAFYNYYGGTMEDEDAAMDELKKVQVSDVPRLAEYYAEIDNKGKDLYKDFKKYLSATQYKSIQKWLN